jgi:glutamate-1-semialdehyde 2,1-aminomutase
VSAAGDAHRGWRERAAAVVAAGASTGSKRPAALYGASADADAPLHFTRASGCRVTTVGGETLVDLGSALGAVALGYADPEVTRRVCDAAGGRPVALLTHASEVTLAERLRELIPCAEKVLFLKSGAEAGGGGGAARARGHRARRRPRERLLRVARLVERRGRGSPPARTPTSWRCRSTTRRRWRRRPTARGTAWRRSCSSRWSSGLPSATWLPAARRLCDRVGAVLIFDEVKTGCRLHVGGFQATADAAGVLPDVATFGKALANGYPLAAVVGRDGVMDAARSAWVSSTLASEATALAAAHAVLDRHAGTDVCARIGRHGEALRALVAGALAGSGARDVRVEGIPAMWFLRFGPDAERGARREARFLDAARAAGVLFKRGAYNYPTLAHDASVGDAVAGAARAGFDAVRAHDEEAA